MKRWVALFSQTGSEIVSISQRLKRYPDVCISNRFTLEGVNQSLVNSMDITLCSKTPSVAEYTHLIGDPENTVVTLNGWLRIIPEGVCKVFEIWNGHPGLITKYPVLKGKDPQQKAIDLGLKTSGCVIHRVIPEVDSGEIVVSREISIENLLREEVFSYLHKTSVDLWVDFLKNKL